MSSTRPHAGDALPDTDAFDWLLIMGGPMSAHDARRLETAHMTMNTLLDALSKIANRK